jgi:MFS family permease
VPLGAVADVYGRRRALIVALLAYIAAFAVFGSALGLVGAFVAMALYAVGEAFRGGTHKAMIFDWLRSQRRQSEAADVYGTTRSWSKRGSAVSAVVGAALVLALGEFTAAFWWTAIPYVLNVVNLATYPAELDRRSPDASVRAVATATWDAVRSAITMARLRALLFESMVFEATIKIAATYLQPVIQVAAIATFAGGASDDFTTTVVAAGAIYFVLGLIEASASRRAGGFARWSGGDVIAIGRLWWLHLACSVVLLGSLLADAPWLAIAAFVVQFGVARNLFRAVQLARYDAECPEELAATVLSLESQAQAIVVAVAAPIVGWAIDRAAVTDADSVERLWPAAIAAVVGAGVFAVVGVFARRARSDAPTTTAP